MSYNELNNDQIRDVEAIRSIANEFYELLAKLEADRSGPKFASGFFMPTEEGKFAYRNLELARRHMEDAEMRAVRFVTK